MPYIIDTYAWIEYFRGTETGDRIQSKIDIGGNITPTIVLGELKKKYVEEDIEGFDEDLRFIKSKSEILPLDEQTAINAGEIRSTIGISGIGIVDCILIALSRQLNVKVLTGDSHFQNLDEAEFIENEIEDDT